MSGFHGGGGLLVGVGAGRLTSGGCGDLGSDMVNDLVKYRAR
jgi:hypothetical protein